MKQLGNPRTIIPRYVLMPSLDQISFMSRPSLAFRPMLETLAAAVSTYFQHQVNFLWAHIPARETFESGCEDHVVVLSLLSVASHDTVLRECFDRRSIQIHNV